jgi:hypothetical protein
LTVRHRVHRHHSIRGVVTERPRKPIARAARRRGYCERRRSVAGCRPAGEGSRCPFSP